MAGLFKATILGTYSQTDRETGEISRGIELEVLVTRRIRLDGATQVNQLPLYESLVGKVVAVTADEGVLENGRHWMKIRGDGKPMLLVEPQLMPAQVVDVPASVTDDPKPVTGNDPKPPNSSVKFPSSMRTGTGN